LEFLLIVIPEKVAYIKVPKAASTTIARLFWERHGVQQFSTLNQDVATTIRHFVSLEQVSGQISVLNGNWFYNRSGAFGWHAGYRDLVHVFGDELADFHWVASVRHPVSRLFSVFSFQVARERIDASLCARDFEGFCEKVFGGGTGLSPQQRIHTWPQVSWLPTPEEVQDLSIVRQEHLGSDLNNLASRVPSFLNTGLSRVNKSFDGDLERYVSPALSSRIESHYSQDMTRLGY
jgi:hypothetical protein